MPRNPTTGVFTRVSNSFSEPIINTVIDPADALALFNDYDAGLTFDDSEPLILIGSLSGVVALEATNAASGTLVVPNGPDTLAGIAATQTLTNKTLNGSNNTITNVSLATGVTGQLPNANLANMATYTFKGNNTGSPGAPGDVDIALLTTKASPASGDYLLLSDQAASGAWKKVTVSSVGSAGSVSSIAGNTGAFTLDQGVTNSTNAIRIDVSFLQNFLGGLGLANNVTDPTNDIDIAAGVAADSTNAALMKLASAFVKRLDAGWVAGTNQGMRNSAAAITDTTYHIYLVSKASGADVDIYAHTSTTVATVITALQAESGGASYIYARRIGSIIRSGGAILLFTQVGNEFTLATPTTPLSGGTWTNTAADQALTVPAGLAVESFGQFSVSSSSATNYFALFSKSISDFVVNSSTGQAAGIAGTSTGVTTYRVRVNTSGNARKRSSDSSGTGTINCYGWIDNRGQ